MQYNLIVILGPNAPGGESFGSSVDRSMLEVAYDMKFIGDGKSPVDYVAALRQLSNDGSIGPNTVIYIDAYGSVKDGSTTCRWGIVCPPTQPF
jgi:hypothetical protein